jgi:hypothetical protein
MSGGAGAAEALPAGTVLLGSCVQWLTGMGFAPVPVPAPVLLLGPADGVVLANCVAGASAWWVWRAAGAGSGSGRWSLCAPPRPARYRRAPG